MKTFIVYDCGGKILRTGTCQDSDFARQPNAKEFVMEGEANDSTQKIVAGEVVDKSPQELAEATYTPEPVPPERQPARINNKQWQNVLARLKKLEIKA